MLLKNIYKVVKLDDREYLKFRSYSKFLYLVVNFIYMNIECNYNNIVLQ